MKKCRKFYYTIEKLKQYPEIRTIWNIERRSIIG